MPFESIEAFRERKPAAKSIAIVGGGVSGLAAAYYLGADHKITLYEADRRLGGHARTLMAGAKRETPVDTGFMVFNDKNYPRLNALFDDIGAPAKPTNMSFSVSVDNGAFEYGLHNPKRLFAAPLNAVRPSFWRMLLDILKFNREAEQFLEQTEMSLGEALDHLGLSVEFRRRYLFPLAGAIWSTPNEEMADFPAATLIRFFKNHSLLSAVENPQWRTVDGGSREYVSRLEARLLLMGCDLRTGAPVRSVRRTQEGVFLKADDAHEMRYDEVIFACHSDQALNILSDSTADEQDTIGAIRYRNNRVVLHSDVSQMPKRKNCWSSWNYLGYSDPTFPNNSFTYWMNLLQDLPEDEQIFVTLNPATPIRDEFIYNDAILAHPVFDIPALEAQKRLPQLQGKNHTWFCGAYTRYGFHEDGMESAGIVASALAEKLELQGA